MTVENFLGTEVIYLKEAQAIYSKDAKGGLQILLDVRAWGGIQQEFLGKNGHVDLQRASAFQDDMANWITDAINQKLHKATTLYS